MINKELHDGASRMHEELHDLLVGLERRASFVSVSLPAPYTDIGPAHGCGCATIETWLARAEMRIYFPNLRGIGFVSS
jgi:hypothetical protein